MTFSNNSFFFNKYESVIAYLFLAVQYIVVMCIPEFSEKFNARHYAYLWFWDIFLAIPVIISLYLPYKWRLTLVGGICCIALFVFYSDFGSNLIFFNTFIAIFFAHRFLLLPLNPDETNSIAKKRLIRLAVAFGMILPVTMIESMLETLGITQPVYLGENEKVMTNYGRFFMFGGYYCVLAYLEYREVGKMVRNTNDRKPKVPHEKTH